MYKCKYFKIYELIDRFTYEKFGEEAWMFLNPLALISIDGVREFFTIKRGKDVPFTINNWQGGGKFQFRGLRPIFYTAGALYSQHRLGNGFDGDLKNISAEEARQEILANKDHELLKHITCIETNINWVHLDCRNISDRIRIVEP